MDKKRIFYGFIISVFCRKTVTKGGGRSRMEKIT